MCYISTDFEVHTDHQGRIVSAVVTLLVGRFHVVLSPSAKSLSEHQVEYQIAF